MRLAKVQELIKHQAAPGVILFIAALLAFVAENSSLAPIYNSLLETPAGVQIGSFLLKKPLLLWINDGLMAIFFLMVGLELKREFCDGELSKFSQALLPLLCAVGGMIVPAGIFLYFNSSSPETQKGWAIPAATDIAFALGVLSLFGKRVPASLRVFLAALAIFDDLGAIVIIAIFYTANLSLSALGLASLGLLVLLVLNRMRVLMLTPYILVGIFLWVCVLKSGVHATLAGVIVALAIPFGAGKAGRSPVLELEHALHPWVVYGVLPVFGFANAGVSFSGLGLSDLLSPIALGIGAGLVVGKFVGIIAMASLANLLGIAKIPEGASRRQFAGVAMLAGIGFTMALFISSLAFDQLSQITASRIGIIVGSVISALLGSILLAL